MKSVVVNVLFRSGVVMLLCMFPAIAVVGCTKQEKKLDSDALKREFEKLKKEREQEWGKPK